MLGEYHLDLIPFDEDVLSLELPNSFKECNLVRSILIYYVCKDYNNLAIGKRQNVVVLRSQSIDEVAVAVWHNSEY